MEFPTKINKNFVIKIPKNVREFEDYKEGDQVLVSIRRKTDIEAQKNTLDKQWQHH